MSRTTTLTLAAVLALAPLVPASAQHAGHHGHGGGHLGAEVMPFDLRRSLHVFTPGPDGGTQDVLSRDGDAAQVALVREHLAKEAGAFARGDYGDPAAIHGEAMPGLAALREGAGRVRVAFEPIPEGGRIVFKTDDPALRAAVHDWFAAQVRDHGADAELRR